MVTTVDVPIEKQRSWSERRIDHTHPLCRRRSPQAPLLWSEVDADMRSIVGGPSWLSALCYASLLHCCRLKLYLKIYINLLYLSRIEMRLSRSHRVTDPVGTAI